MKREIFIKVTIFTRPPQSPHHFSFTMVNGKICLINEDLQTTNLTNTFL
jgi:hypothetical protein